MPHSIHDYIKNPIMVNTQVVEIGQSQEINTTNPYTCIPHTIKKLIIEHQKNLETKYTSQNQNQNYVIVTQLIIRHIPNIAHSKQYIASLCLFQFFTYSSQTTLPFPDLPLPEQPPLLKNKITLL